MKQIYFTLITFALCYNTTAQSNTVELTGNTPVDYQGSDTESIKPKFQQTKTAGEVLFSETFTGNIDNWTTSGDNGNVWQYDLDGPSGTMSNSSSVISSPTSQTGFVIFDADRENQGAGTSLTGNLESPIIDLSSAPGAILSFYTKYAINTSNFYPIVEVSTDGFTTIHTYKNIIKDQMPAYDTESLKLSINLSSFLSTAANKNQFQFRFAWKDTQLYYWQIDDVTITEAGENDLELDKLFLANILNSYEYTDIPKSFGETLTVQGTIKNMGYSSIPASTRLKITVSDKNGAQVATETGGILKQNNLQLDSDTITFPTSIDVGTLATGEYSIKGELLTTENDFDIANNTQSRKLKITEYELGQTNYERLIFAHSMGKQHGVKPKATEMTFGNIMVIPSSQNKIKMQGLVITLRTTKNYSTTENSKIEIKLFGYDQNNRSFADLNESRIFTITKANIPEIYESKDVLFNLNLAEGSKGPFELDGGKHYYIGVYCKGDDDHFAYQINCGDEDASSRVYGPFGNNGAIGWFINRMNKDFGMQISTRMNFDPKLELAGLNESQANDKTNCTLYPNPSSQQTTLHYSLTKKAEVKVKVTDIAGKVLTTIDEGSQEEGNHKILLDAPELNSGIYYVTLHFEDTIITKKWMKK